MQACLSPLSGKLLLQVIIVKKNWLKQLPCKPVAAVGVEMCVAEWKAFCQRKRRF